MVGWLVKLVAGREKAHFHEMPDWINWCLHQKSARARSGLLVFRDGENGENLEGQRNTEVYLSSTRPF